MYALLLCILAVIAFIIYDTKAIHPAIGDVVLYLPTGKDNICSVFTNPCVFQTRNVFAFLLQAITDGNMNELLLHNSSNFVYYFV